MNSQTSESFKKDSFMYLFLKRIFDIVISFTGLVFTSPVFIVCMILSAISTHYFPIYKDSRIGKDGKPINILKFRTMYKDAESNIDSYLNSQQKEDWEKERKVENDPRVTKIGKILRRTSLDELPQLLNVIAGTLSLIGPRPITDWEIKNNFSEKEAKWLLSVKPGVTGYWQVIGRSNDSWESGKRKELNIYYLEHRSIRLDLYTFFMTFLSVIKFFFSDKNGSH